MKDKLINKIKDASDKINQLSRTYVEIEKELYCLKGEHRALTQLALELGYIDKDGVIVEDVVDADGDGDDTADT